jgi:L-2-hydroxyglutarate oxidase
VNKTDIVIVGGGIVGLATAYQLSRRYPSKHVTVLEKEPTLAQHQTGHNSGVLHSGIYYKPGSLKAINCRAGKLAMEQFCQQNQIPYQICGKVIVATRQAELPALETIFKRGQQNGVRCEFIDQARLRELEPHAHGIRAIHVPEAGIVNFRQVCQILADSVTRVNGRIITSARVTNIAQNNGEIVVESTAGPVRAAYLVNCAGLHSDRVTRMSGQKLDARIIPFRGEYYQLKPEAYHLCRTLIYPVPDPHFPFLGVHFTRMIDGTVECGPNAVLAFAREGYHKTDVNFRDLWESITYKGFLKLAAKYWQVGAGEIWRSISKRAFVKALQRLVPSIEPHLLETAPAGVRAQAVGSDGSMIDDFLILESDRVVNVCNAPSPAATSSLNIGQTIVDKLSERF